MTALHMQTMIPIHYIGDIRCVASIGAAALHGRVDVHVPWPVEVLGKYGSHTYDGSPVSPSAADAAMDRWVLEHLAVPPGCVITSIIAGRAKGAAGRRQQETPCIVVRVCERQMALQIADCEARRVRYYGVGHRSLWVDGRRAW